jgi:TrkA domain protein
MKVFETELPGVGRRYTLTFPAGGEFVIVVRNNGRRQAYWREESDDDSEELFEATESQARKIAEIFDGTYFHPVEESLDHAFEDARIKWIDVGETSPLVNHQIRESELRSRTGVSVLAIQRGDQTISNPDPDTKIQPGDTLVVVGTDDAYEALDEVLTA